MNASMTSKSFKYPSVYTLDDLGILLRHPAEPEQTMDTVFHLYNNINISKPALWHAINDDPNVDKSSQEVAIWTYVMLRNGMRRTGLDKMDDEEDKENISSNISRENTTRPITIEELTSLFYLNARKVMKSFTQKVDNNMQVFLQSVMKNEDEQVSQEYFDSIFKLSKAYWTKYPQYTSMIKTSLCDKMIHLSDTMLNKKQKYMPSSAVYKNLTFWYNVTEQFINENLYEYRNRVIAASQGSNLNTLISMNAGKLRKTRKTKRGKRTQQKRKRKNKTKMKREKYTFKKSIAKNI